MKSIFLSILLLALKLTIFQESEVHLFNLLLSQIFHRISGEQRQRVHIERKIRSHLDYTTYTRRMYKKSLLWRFLVCVGGDLII